MFTVDVVIAAAGSGKRMGAGRNKLLLNLQEEKEVVENSPVRKSSKTKGLTLLEYGLKAFRQFPGIRTVFLVVSSSDRPILEPLEEQEGLVLVDGGKRRQDSVHKALEQINQNDEPPDMVLIHDGARIFCTEELIERVLKGCREKGSAVPVIPLQDTVRKILPREGATNGVMESWQRSFSEADLTCELLDRSELYAVQTPQGFRFEDLWKASLKSQKENWEVTDDASLLEKTGKSIHPVPGEAGNLKITTSEDLAWARWKFQSA